MKKINEFERFLSVPLKIRNKLRILLSKHLLVGYQSNCSAFEQAEGVGRMVESSGGEIKEIDVLPSNFYAFK